MEPTQEPADREVFLEDQGQAFDRMRGKARRGEPGQVRPFREWLVGDELYRDTGERHRVERVYDHENDRYTKRITDQAGNVIETADKPLSEHRGHGAAKRRPPTDPAA